MSPKKGKSILAIRHPDDKYAVILLFITWLLATGKYSWFNLGLGLAISYFTVVLIHSNFTRVVSKKLFLNFFAVLAFIILLIKEVIVSSYQVAYLALHPALPFESSIVKAKSKVRNRHKSITLVLLGNVITLTPGTLTLDLDSKEKILYIHCLDHVKAEDDNQLREEIFGDLERGIRRIFK